MVPVIAPTAVNVDNEYGNAYNFWGGQQRKNLRNVRRNKKKAAGTYDGLVARSLLKAYEKGIVDGGCI